MVLGEEEPRGAGLPVIGLVLPGKAALTYPDAGKRCVATQLPAHQPCISSNLSNSCSLNQQSATGALQRLHEDPLMLGLGQVNVVPGLVPVSVMLELIRVSAMLANSRYK